MDTKLNAKRIPREQMHSQDERLTNKHIQTLSFTQEIVNENKELKKKLEELEKQLAQCSELHALAENSQTRIKQIQDQCMKRADEINIILTEKHKQEITNLLDENMKREKQFTEEIYKLKKDVELVQANCSNLTAKLNSQSMSEQESDVPGSKLLEAQQELDALRSERTKFAQERANQFAEIQSLQNTKSQNEAKEQELKECKQKNKELSFRIAKMEKELAVAITDKEQVDLIDLLKNKLSKLHKDKSQHMMEEDESKKQMDKLQADLERMQQELYISEFDRKELIVEHRKTVEELKLLKKQMFANNDKLGFKDFVILKRELAAIREENENLKAIVVSREKSNSLPMLKYEIPVRKIASGKKDKKSTASRSTASLK